MKALLLGLLRVYKLGLSPVLMALTGGGCRYLPSCSDYMQQAITLHGVRRGVWLGTKRLCRCHPWSRRDSDDPVPLRCDPCDQEERQKI